MKQTHVFKFIQPDLNKPARIDYYGTMTEVLEKFHKENPGVKDWSIETNDGLPDWDFACLNKF